MSPKPDLPRQGDNPSWPTEAESLPLKPEEEPKERSVFGLAAELKNRIRDDREEAMKAIDHRVKIEAEKLTLQLYSPPSLMS